MINPSVVFPGIRTYNCGMFDEIVEAAIEEVLNNRKSPKDALDTAAKEITGKLEQYNKTVGK